DDGVARRHGVELRRGQAGEFERLHGGSDPSDGCFPMNYSFRFTPVIARIDQLLAGLVTSVWVSAVAIALGFLVGLAGAVAARSRSKAARRIVLVYVEAIRNTPLLAQL